VPRDCARTRAHELWHSWSSNSRWLVFSSKWNTPYTQLFLTHIDENGEDTPPVLLERFTGKDRAANIPEFVRVAPDAIAHVREGFLDPYSFLRQERQTRERVITAVRSVPTGGIGAGSRERGLAQRSGMGAVSGGQDGRGYPGV